MADENDVGSNPATDTAVQNETPATPEKAEKPSSPTAREALEKAFAGTLEGKPEADEPAKAEKPDAKDAGKEANAEEKPDGEPAEPAEAPEAGKAADDPNPPPSRFTATAKAKWATVPDEVKADIQRMESELTQGIEKYKAAFEPIKQYDEMARSSGTTLDQALKSYVGIENLLRSDPMKGFAAICQNMGVDPREVGKRLAGMEDQGQQGHTPEVAALKSEIQSLKTELGKVGRTFQERDAVQMVNEFAKEKPRFDELSPVMAEMLKTGFAKDLQDAYEKAERLNPAPAPAPQPAPSPAPVAATTPDPAQTRKAGLSLTGTPSPGSNPGQRKPAGSTRDALARSFAQVGLN